MADDQEADASWSCNSLRGVGLCGFLIIVMILSGVLFHSSQSPPLFQLKRLYIPALDNSLNSSTLMNPTIQFRMSFELNTMCSAVYFDPVNVSFYDGPKEEQYSIANFTIPEFHLEEDDEFYENNKVEYSGMLNATGLDLDAAKQEIAANGFKLFRLNLITSVRYQYYAFWKTGRYPYEKSVDVKIGDTGAAPKFGNGFVGVRVQLVILNIMVMVILCSY